MKIIFYALFFVIVTSVSWAEDSQILATVDGEKITNEEVLNLAKQRMVKIESQIYDIKRSVIEELIDQKLLNKEAKKKSKTVSDLFNEVQNKAGNVTEDEARAIFELQKNRQFKGQTFDDVKKNLMAQLLQQKRQLAVNDYLEGLRQNATVQINLKRPRFDVSTDDDPAIGKKNAPVVLVEFSEFQCPFCKKARPVIDKILNTYGDKVYYVFRDFPLSFHKQAKGAANAANCAGDQGKYWDYSRELWTTQGSHTEEELPRLAKKLKLNMDEFEKCVEGKKYYDEIESDLNDGSDAGVSGTPAYFINGVFLSGAQPFERFKELIDEELKTRDVSGQAVQ